MIPLWMQSLLQFLLWYAVASIGGCASYWVLRLAPEQIRDVVGKGSVFLIALCCLAQPQVIFVLVMLVTVPSFVAAFCERSMDQWSGTWSSHFWVSILTYLVSVAVIIAVLVAAVVFISIIAECSGHVFAVDLLDLDGTPPMWGIELSFLLTPASVSLLRWMLVNSQLRPGIDRHLKEGESE